MRNIIPEAYINYRKVLCFCFNEDDLNQVFAKCKTLTEESRHFIIRLVKDFVKNSLEDSNLGGKLGFRQFAEVWTILMFAKRKSCIRIGNVNESMDSRRF